MRRPQNSLPSGVGADMPGLPKCKPACPSSARAHVCASSYSYAKSSFKKSKLLVELDEIQEGFAIESGKFFDGAK